jgi:Peptidase_C39 like family
VVDSKPILLSVPRIEQPDNLTCGPTCLAQVYRYYGYQRSLDEVIRETARNADGGTLAVNLGISALRNRFRATIYSYNLRVFDPTWRTLDEPELIEKIRRRRELVDSKRLRRSLEAYITYLEAGGRVHFNELGRELLARLLAARRPILTGLSATYLYRIPREFDDKSDDVRGEPVGHFVVICGYYPKSDRFVICDPLANPISRTGKYTVDAERLISAILLGDVTYDADLLVLTR